MKISDSCRTLPNSLENLAENLRSRVRPQNCSSCKHDQICESCQSKKSSEEVFPNTHNHIKQNFGIENTDKFFKKQIFPHNMVTGIDSLINVTTFPPKENFQVGLNSEEKSGKI